MKNYRKTLWASFIAFFLGTSCCWLSALAVWIGGGTLFGTIILLVEDAQMLLLGFGMLLGIATIYLYQRRK